LPADVAAPLLADRLRTQAVIAYSQVRHCARQTILDSYPTLALRGEPLGASSTVLWSIIPLLSEDISRLGPLETNRLIDGKYAPFLASVIGARNTYLLLWLPTIQSDQ
jgi:hypothetical protein